MDAQAQRKRLRWRCRRGTRELDVLFGWWLEAQAPHADQAALQAFDELMDSQDPDLWDWTLGHSRPPREDWKAIIDVIRTHHHL